MKKILKFVGNKLKVLPNFIEDIFILLGSLFIILATFTISTVAGMYVLGVFFILFGVYFSLYPPADKRKRG